MADGSPPTSLAPVTVGGSNGAPPVHAAASPWPARIAAVAIGLFLLLLFVNGRPLGNVHTGDSDFLVQGAQVALDCLDDGVFSRCALVNENYSAVSPYPLLQFLPAAAFLGLGLDNEAAVTGLAVLNGLALLASLACVLVVSRRVLAGWAPALLIVILSSPLLFYSTAGFGEMLATFLALLGVSLVLLRRPVGAAVVLGLACLGKDTMAPFLLMLALLCGRDEGDGWLPPRSMLVAIGSGIGAGVVLTTAFNLFRYGQLFNLFYLQSAFRVPGPARQVNHFGALWAAPNGGMLWFWTSATAFLVVALVVLVRRLRAAPDRVRDWLPLAVALAVAVGFQLLLAQWAHPFGWISWGPRLTLPIVPAVCVTLAYVGGEAFRATAARVLRPRWGAAVVILVLAVASLPQSGVVWNYTRATASLLAGDSTCAPLQLLPNPPSKRYFRCQSHLMWRRTPSFLVAPLRSSGAVQRWAQASLVIGLASLVLLWRRGSTSTRRPPALRAPP